MKKVRKSLPIRETATVNMRDANLVVQGVDCRAIGSSFKAHLAKDDRRIASGFYLQASEAITDRLASFDFFLPLKSIERPFAGRNRTG
jgi:hypothetical protein